MLQVTFWQVAAGLGVGAFLAAVFYGIVRQFGRRKGEGFETSKLGKEATAIIAVLIVILGAAITIVGLVLYAPQRSEGSQRDRDEQLAAIDSFVAGNAALFDELESYCKTYPQEFKELTSEGTSPADAYDQLVMDLYGRIRVFANIAKSYSHLEAAFPGFQLNGRGWDDLRERNRELFSAFTGAVREAVVRGIDPAKDADSRNAFEAYIEYRKSIADECRKSVIP